MKDLNEARLLLNDIDDKMKALFIERMSIIKEIAEYKKNNNLPIYDSNREKEMIERLSKDTGEVKDNYIEFLSSILKESKKYQENIIKQWVYLKKGKKKN